MTTDATGSQMTTARLCAASLTSNGAPDHLSVWALGGGANSGWRDRQRLMMAALNAGEHVDDFCNGLDAQLNAAMAASGGGGP